MEEPLQTSSDAPQDNPGPPSYRLFVWLGPLIVFLGAVSYFLIFTRYPALRDFPWINLPFVLLGLVISFIGLRRAFHPARSIPSKVTGSFGFLFSVAVTFLFAAYIFHLSYQLPSATNTPKLDETAPEFALLDSSGSTARLSDLRGKKVVVVFYRGHW